MSADDILNIVQGSLYGINLLLAFMYSCSILFIRRFHHRNNIFILNMCITIMLTWIYFIIYFLVANYEYPRQLCNILYYAFNVASVEVPFAFVAFSVHRLCSIVYHTKPFFKTKRWVIICIASQWIAQFIISLPFFLRKAQYCTNEFWLTIYTLVTAAILPSLINIILNTLIFFHVRSSSHRVHPQTASALTSTINNQQPKISRRDISLLRQMIFMFSMFIGGFTPVFIVNIIYEVFDISFMVVSIAVIFSELCVLGIVINLFMYNHELREYLLNKLRVCFIR